jgi:carboxyl-terminal processing protease
MTGRIFAFVAAFCLLAATSTLAQAEPRVALVVGNSNYGPEIGKLANPANDAALMAAALQKTGFTVIKVIDADQKQMKRKIAEFGDALAAAGPKATGLFFYAGHGIQSRGMNYLIPVGAQIAKEADVKIESVTADDVMEQMEFASNQVNIIILDACRNNPVARSMRSASRGLAPMQSDSVRGTFIAYSTSPGQTAADGSGSNSPYSQALASTIVKPGVGIEEAFRQVRAQVMAATEDKQIPWDSSSLTAPFFFKPSQFTTSSAPAPAVPAAKPAATSTPASLEVEQAMWDGIKDSKEAGDYQVYLERYPNGIFAQMARNRLASLGQGAPREQPAEPQIQEPAAQPAATEVSTEPELVAEPAAAATATGDGILRDSRGLDCRVKDSTRSEAECKGMGKANGGGGGYGGGKSSAGSHGWN